MSSAVSADIRKLLDRARDGHDESLGRLLQFYAGYLKLMARTRLDVKVRVRASPSDVVQETLLRAHRDFAQFRGATTEEFSAWLSAILINNLKHLMQHHLAAKKRDVRREVSIDDAVATLECSAAGLVSVLADEGPSPSSGALQHEASLVLADALESLSEDYRDVIVLRHLDGLSFGEIADRMTRSHGAVRMLWMRAIDALRKHFKNQGML